MKIRTFEIRLSEEYRAADEEALNVFLAQVEPLQVEMKVLPDGAAWAVAVLSGERSPSKKSAPIVSDPEREMTPEELSRYEALRLWRNERAAQMGWSAYLIASNRNLVDVAKTPVEKPEELLAIKGFGKQRVEKYGEEIVAVLDSIG